MASQYMIPFSGEAEYSDIDHSTLGFNYQDRMDRAKVAYQHVKRWTKSSDDINRDNGVNKAKSRRTDHLATHTQGKVLRHNIMQDKQNARDANAQKIVEYHQQHAKIKEQQGIRKNNRNLRYEAQEDFIHNEDYNHQHNHQQAQRYQPGYNDLHKNPPAGVHV